MELLAGPSWSCRPGSRLWPMGYLKPAALRASPVPRAPTRAARRPPRLNRIQRESPVRVARPSRPSESRSTEAATPRKKRPEGRDGSPPFPHPPLGSESSPALPRAIRLLVQCAGPFPVLARVLLSAQGGPGLFRWSNRFAARMARPASPERLGSRLGLRIGSRDNKSLQCGPGGAQALRRVIGPRSANTAPRMTRPSWPTYIVAARAAALASDRLAPLKP